MRRSAARVGDRRRLLLLVAAAVLCAGFVTLACLARRWPALAGWDGRVTGSFVSWRSPGRDRFFWLATLLGDDPLMAAFAAVFVFALALWGLRARAAVIAGGLAVSWGVMHAAKLAVGRARPPEPLALVEKPGSFSMPSGHALIIVVFCGLLVYTLFRWVDARRARRAAGGGAQPRAAAALMVTSKAVVVLVALTLSAVVGMSRVYLGVHWMSDVFAGWCLGGAVLAATLSAAFTLERTRGKGVFRERERWGREGTRIALLVALFLIVCAVTGLTAWADPLL